ncbi:MAG: hypothetical protein BWY82_02841 [Verrucomicrobia bacterium ADurb.Bin474]|nr:MAG: hypothetical protein BWY82_02841 [Verrucomicrobia bacterium ADurb.Bin474]
MFSELAAISADAAFNCLRAWDNVSVLEWTSRIMLWTFSMKTLNQRASSPTSSPELTLRRRVRSPSPWAISLSIAVVSMMGREIS